MIKTWGRRCILQIYDMVVMGKVEGDLKESLKMVGVYGREWKMQFKGQLHHEWNMGSNGG